MVSKVAAVGIAVAAAAGIGAIALRAHAAPPTGAAGYSIGLSETEILTFGIPTLQEAIADAQNYQANSQPNPPTLYVYSTDASGHTVLVQSVSPTAPTGPYLLEVYDYNGNRVLKLSEPDLASAQSYVKANYGIASSCVGAAGTYDIFDAATSLVAYGCVSKIG